MGFVRDGGCGGASGEASVIGRLPVVTGGSANRTGGDVGTIHEPAILTHAINQAVNSVGVGLGGRSEAELLQRLGGLWTNARSLEIVLFEYPRKVEAGVEMLHRR